MEPEEWAAFAFLVCEYSTGKKNRKWWFHAINAVRLRDGHFSTLHTPLREDPAKFLNYFRMKARTFRELLSRVQTL
jgi:hypothetical protein